MAADRNMIVRSASAVGLMAFLVGIVRGGHGMIACTCVFCVFEIFRELVNVGMHEGNAARELPLYSSLQWLWFAIAMFAAYTADFMRAPMNVLDNFGDAVGAGGLSQKVEPWLHYRAYALTLMYCFAFMLTVLMFKEGHYSVQLHVLAFTSLALSLFVVQLKAMLFNLYLGMFWFVVPLMLVITNDTAAYFVGKALGRVFVKRPLIALSPKKSWEGFTGALILTLAAGALAPTLLRRYLPYSHFLYLTCSHPNWVALGDKCVPPPHFADSALEGLGVHCAVLGAFASLVAPFGGFMASAIKRAYQIKDFDTFIPGHGGLMDRLDCQFLMAVFTCAHVTTFLETGGK